MIAYKLFRVRRDGSLGSLFINRTARIAIKETLQADSYITPGYAFRPGWHCCQFPNAPHLTMKGRQWWAVDIADFDTMERPAAQGGRWYLAQKMRVLVPVTQIGSLALTLFAGLEDTMGKAA
jgi:hypothetical protein